MLQRFAPPFKQFAAKLRHPYTRSVCATAVSISFLFAATAKGLDLRQFHIVISTLTFLPDWAKPVLSPGIPIAEAAVACLILWPGTRQAGLVVGGGMLVAFTLFLIPRVFDPLAGTCHCLGGLPTGLLAKAANAVGVVRNAVLIGAAWAALTPGVPPTRSEPAGVNTDVIDGSGATRIGLSTNTGTTIARSAFTLVEVLVTTAMLGLLLGLLLPVVVDARRTALQSQCANNLRSLGMDAAVWAAGHRGYLPLDGQAMIPDLATVRGHWPFVLRDSDQSRYAYHQTLVDGGEEERPLPFLAALLAESVPRSASGDWTGDYRWTDLVPSYPTAMRLRCPAIDRRPESNGFIVAGSTLTLSMPGNPGEYDSTGWRVITDYGTNGGLLGFDADPAHAHRRYAGLTTRPRNPAAMVLATDAAGLMPVWVPTTDGAAATVTLADALAGDGQMWDLNGRFDAGRHRGLANVLLLDGHVEAVRIDPRSLAGYYLLDR